MKKLFLVLMIFIVSCIEPPKKEDKNMIRLRHISDSLRISDIAVREKLKKENNMGIWEVDYYVDQFGEKTGKIFVTTSKLIWGRFSNTATENSDLLAKIYIDSFDKVSIQLFEYAGDNSVKDSGQQYIVDVKNDQSEYLSMLAYNNSDRLVIHKDDSNNLNKLLLHSSWVKFVITNRTYSTSKYYFEIPDISGFKNAYRKVEGNY